METKLQRARREERNPELQTRPESVNDNILETVSRELMPLRKRKPFHLPEVLSLKVKKNIVAGNSEGVLFSRTPFQVTQQTLSEGVNNNPNLWWFNGRI